MNQPELNPHEILGSLGVEGINSVTPVSGGFDTAIWRVEAQGQMYALRVFRPEQRGTIIMESLAHQAAHAAGIAVPQMHATGEWHGRPTMLISWCEGRTVLEEFRRRPWKAWSMATSFGRMQAKVHQVTAPAELQEHRARWLEWNGGSGDPALQERLRTMPQRTDVLIHMDYHPLNVLVDGAAVTGVIDWTNAHAGDPRADVAQTLVILSLAPPARRLIAAPFRRFMIAGWLHGYTQEAGPLGDMAPFYAWAGGAMRGDWARKIERQETEFTAKDLEPMDRWIASWRRRIRPAL